MNVQVEITWSDPEKRQLHLLDTLRDAMFQANGCDDDTVWQSRAFARQDAVYGKINEAFIAALDTFGSCIPTLYHRLGFESSEEFARWTLDQCIDNGESPTYQIERALKDGRP